MDTNNSEIIVDDIDDDFGGNVELISKFNVEREQLSAAHEQYLKQHPEVRQISADYLKAIMHRRPDDLYQFTRDYFRMFQSTQANPGASVA